MVRALPLLVVLSLAACSGSSSSSSQGDRLPPDEAASVLIDRNWIDIWPTSKTERLHVYRFTPAMGGGVYQDRTIFKGTFELFMFEIDGDHLAIELPETDDAVRTGYRIDRVDGPEPFDLRLTLERSPRGPKVYYGRTAERAASWPIRDLTDR